MTQQEYDKARADYMEYYKSSPEWQAKRAERLKIDGYRCVGCGARGTMANALTVHHLRYASKYGADSRVNEDLVTLCSSCHSLIHRVQERITNPATNKRGFSGVHKDIVYHAVANIGNDRIYFDIEEEF